MTELFLDILDNDRQAIFAKLQQITAKAILGGGTALALQIGHRKSYDFDLFLKDPIPPTLYHRIQNTFGESPIKRIDSDDQLTVQLANGIEITVLYYWFSPLYPPITSIRVPLFDIHDIATDKAFTIGKRNAWRDYVDFFYLLHDRHTTLPQIIIDGQKRFGNEFSAKLFLQQLTYAEDITDFSYTPIGKMYEQQDIMSFLITEVREYMDKIKSSF